MLVEVWTRWSMHAVVRRWSLLIRRTFFQPPPGTQRDLYGRIFPFISSLSTGPLPCLSTLLQISIKPCFAANYFLPRVPAFLPICNKNICTSSSPADNAPPAAQVAVSNQTRPRPTQYRLVYAIPGALVSSFGPPSLLLKMI